MDALGNEYWTENRAGGNAQANRLARERMSSWGDLQVRLNLVPGKEVLAKLSAWLQENYGVSVSALRLAGQIRTTEIPQELKSVLTSIEMNEPF